MRGVLLPLTITGEFTIQRLHLNRLPLLAHRRRVRPLHSPPGVVAQQIHLTRLVIGLLKDQAALVNTQQRLLLALLELLQRTSDQGRREGDENES